VPIYRVLKPLSKGFNKVIKAGQVIDLNWLDSEQLAKLVQVGAISRLQAPPLHKLPGWTARSKRLRKAGFDGVEAFLEADDEQLAEAMNLKARTVRRWKEELTIRYLVIPEEWRR